MFRRSLCRRPRRLSAKRCHAQICWVMSARSSATSENAETSTWQQRRRPSNFSPNFNNTSAERNRKLRNGLPPCPQERTLDVFHLDEEMLVRSTQLTTETGLKLESFDNAILAAVLVRGAALRDAGYEVCFCTTDTHLQPWDKDGNRKNELRDLLDDVGVWVYGDFLLEWPPRPPSSPT